ncbi:thiamin pyrophosphokinase [Microlunatus endophyticus]|uniref:Thiamin pyrophosphokinase n=1 Tax=Microlunatus endophyticus TaxID=1716077 RepID=A0A917VZM0_9ACTN|nr:putative cytokinetic ring protein SteA [Microlunatus endophyticus]GGL49696.1 thiamin pyrophosphokinase [Microlunatus endophyticus]
MKLSTLLRRRAAGTDLGGVVRLDRRTKNLTKRIRPGEIAVIDHQDLDRVSAEALVQRGVAAVINVAATVSGRYPTFGPQILLDAGIPLIDRADGELFDTLTEGDRVLLERGTVLNSRHEVLGKGELVDQQALDSQLAGAQAGLSDQILAFTENTMNYLREEKDLLLEGVGVPEVKTVFEGRHVLIVVRGYDYREDLAALRSYITETRPLLIGVDGGADALLEAGYVPDIILGDMDSCSDAALHCGAELVVHAYRDGRAPGLERIERAGLTAVVFPVLGTSEDAAMLLADSKGAQLIVAVGTHASLVEFLDKGRSGMASTFLTRLRVGPKLVDAKGVSRIYHSEVKVWQVLLLVLSALVALVTAMAFTDFGRQVGDLLVARWNDIVYWVKELFT